jgi:hypothetical protein
MPFFVNGAYEVVGAGGVPYLKTIQITTAAWNKCDSDVKTGVMSILASPPIRMLSPKERGNGIKQESKGVEFHTQTNSRLQASGFTVKDPILTFDNYGRAWGH